MAIEELEYFPADLHPASPGLYPWGADGFGTTYFWLTRGTPDDWPIVVINPEEGGETREFDCSFLEFLLQYVRGDIPDLAGPLVPPDPYPGPTLDEVKAEVARRKATAPSRPPLGLGRAFDELLLLLPRPSGTIPGTAVQWEAAEKECGLVFPAEYRQFIDSYGEGRIGTLEVKNALSGLPEWSRSMVDAEREWAIRWKQTRNLPAGFHSDQPGLFPWGSDDYNNNYHWLTLGEPDEWPIVVLCTRRRPPVVHWFPCRFAEFLVRYVRGELSELPLPDDIAGAIPRFEPR